MTKCTQCNWKYPDELLNPLMTNKGYIPDVCGICALQISNMMMGEKRKTFNGETAEDLRQQAIEWRLKHADKKPKVN